MKITKTIGSLVLTAVLLTSVSPLTNANEIQTNNTKTAHQSYENINGVKINSNPNLPMNPEAQQRIGGTKVVKTAIKLIINNRGKAKNVIQQVGGKKAATIFDKGYSGIVKELKPLLKWSEVPANAVGDAVKRGAINAGLSKGDAGIISTVVKEAIAWLF
ncbi:hypothetical protein L2U46_09085 [Staphylococcus aureus]|nr:hypothetical protein [Staphylococcus aureus]